MSMFKCKCPKCDQILIGDESLQGQEVICSSCKTQFVASLTPQIVAASTPQIDSADPQPAQSSSPVVSRYRGHQLLVAISISILYGI